MTIARLLFIAALGCLGVRAQQAPISITLEGATPVQAVFSYDAPGSAPCTVKVAEASTPDVLVHDVNPRLFAAANEDLSRATTFSNGNRRFVTVGARTADLASDGKLYSRALQAATTHTLSVDCVRTAGTLTFDTQNPPLGNTYPEIPPFHTAGFGNYGWPTVDWADSSKTYVDPITGFLLKPAHSINPKGQSGEWGNKAEEWQFTDVFDLNQAWRNTTNIFAASKSGPFATYSGARSDPLFLPFPPFPVDWWVTIGGWYPGSKVWDDARLTLYGSGADSDPENRKVLVCLSVFYAPASNQCAGREIELTLPAGSAGVVSTPDFPRAPFAGWNIGRFLTMEEAGIPNGTVAVKDSIVTWKSGYTFPLSMPAGVKIKIGSNWYTVSSIDNATQLTLAEPLVTLSATSYQLGGFGIRIRKKTGTGTISFNTSWALAWTMDPGMPINGELDLCSRLTVPVDYQADGVTPMDPPRSGRFCVLGTDTRLLILLIPETGETRVLSPLDHSDAGSTSPPKMPSGAFSATDPLVLYAYHGDDAVASAKALYRISYDSSTCHFRALNSNNYLFPGSQPQSDCLTWNNITPASKGLDITTQFQSAASKNPFWDPAVMSNSDPAFGGITGNYAVFAKFFAGPQDTPCFFATFDLTTGRLIQVTDSFGGSSSTMRWGACHTTPATMVDKWIAPALTNLTSRYGSGYLSGPFQVRSVDALSKDGGATWSNDTGLNNMEAGPCTVTDPQMTAKGATGNRCVKVHISSDTPCSLSPANGDAARFPCPWKSSLAGPMKLQAGDYISDLSRWPDSFDGKAEKMLITTKTDLGDNNWELELMRWSTCDDQYFYSHITAENTATHPNGWRAYMSGTGMCGGTYAWFDAGDTSHTFYTDTSSVTSDHGATGPAPNGLYATLVAGGASRIGPIPDQFNLPANFNQNLTTTVFAGVKRESGGDVESYPNLGQWTAPDAEKQFAFDLRHLNPGFGSGPENPSAIWQQTYRRVPGTTQVYKIDNYGAVFGKVFPYLAFAGRHLLKDMSGPASNIGDGDTWKFCVAYQPGECRSGSSIDDAYVNVPRANLSDGCIVNTYALNSPCFTTPYGYGAWAVQYQYNVDDPDGKRYRRMTMGFTGPGRQYQFQNLHVTPEGRWAFLAPGWVDGVRQSIMMVKIPPPPPDDQVDRSRYIPFRVDLQPDIISTAARLRFGYADNGTINSFFCTSRQEACLTDARVAPFAYEKSDTLTGTPCVSGCTLYVPVLPGLIVYFQTERLDDAGKVTSTGPVQVYVAP